MRVCVCFSRSRPTRVLRNARKRRQKEESNSSRGKASKTPDRRFRRKMMLFRRKTRRERGRYLSIYVRRRSAMYERLRRRCARGVFERLSRSGGDGDGGMRVATKETKRRCEGRILRS